MRLEEIDACLGAIRLEKIHRKTIGKWWFNGGLMVIKWDFKWDFMGSYPPVICYIANLKMTIKK